MAFLKLDTSKLNNRYSREKPRKRSQQVTTFNSPAKNRAPEVPKTEAKEGDVLSYFDESKGKVLSSFDGGYQAANTAKISDMNRVDLGMDPIDIHASASSRITFKGVVQAGLVGQNIITITSGNKTQYIPSGTKKLYLDGSQGGDVGSFIRANVACEINEIIIDDAGHFDACIVILESGGANWTFEFGTSSAQNNDLRMDSDDLFSAELASNDMIIASGGRALFTRSSNDWKLHSLSSLDGIIMQTGTLQPIVDDTYDLGSATKQWRNGYFDGTLEADAITIDGDTLSTFIAETMLTNSAGHVVVNDNESTGENNLIPFIEDASATGNVGLESDGDLYYNPNYSKLTVGNIDIGNTLTVTSVVQVGAGGTDDASFSCGQIDLGMYRYATNVLGFTCDDEDSYRMADTYFYPGGDNHSDLGGSSNAWKDVYYEGSISDTSDIRFKKNIDDSDLGLLFINDLRSVKYNHKTDRGTDKKKYGLIAQEVQGALSKAGIDSFSGVIDQDETHLRIDYTQFISPLIKAVQELSKEVEELKKK